MQLARHTTPRQASLLFHSSLLYLALVFVAAAVDVAAWSVMLDPETERKNLLWGWGLFVLFCLLALGTFAIAFIYLAVD